MFSKGERNCHIIFHFTFPPAMSEGSSFFISLPILGCCSVAQLYPTVCNPVDSSTPGFPDHHQGPELAQTHVHRVSDAIQLSHPLSSPFLPAFILSQHQGLFLTVDHLFDSNHFSGYEVVSHCSFDFTFP